MYRKWSPLVVLIALALLVGACASVKPPSRGRADVTDHRRVFFSQADSAHLQGVTAILSDTILRDEFGHLSVTLPIRSTARKPLDIEYQYEFFDGQGRRIEGPMGWTALTLEPGAPATLQFVSATPQAQDYRITIRRQR